MTCKQDMILRALYADPIPDKLDWELIARFLVDLGCLLVGGDTGSHVRFQRQGVVATFQRSGSLVRRHQIRHVREFLAAAGMGL